MIKNIEEWEVLTPSGWSDFDGIKKITKESFYRIETSKGELKCSAEHRLKMLNGKFQCANSIRSNDVLFNDVKVLKIELVEQEIELFDLLDVEEDNEYFTNDVVSHNCAHIPEIGELWTGLYPTMALGGSCIALSSPNGVGNWFHQIYTEAEAGVNDFHPIKLHWSLHPERDQAWFKSETKNLAKRKIEQEYNCSFNLSGESVIDPEDLDRIERTDLKEPKQRTGPDRNLWIWEEPQERKNYLMVADISRGDGNDYSVFHVLDLLSMEIVAEYQGKIEPELFAAMLNEVGREYNNCMVVCENNNLGYMVLSKLIDMQYPNLYYSTKSSHEYVDQYTAETLSNSIVGFTTTKNTRPLVIAKLEEFIRNRVIIIRSKRTLNELKTFVWNNGRAEAMRGYNDDLTMALAIACWVRDTALITNNREMEYKKAFLTSMFSSRTTVNTKIRGQDGYKPNSSFFKEKPADIDPQFEYRWVLVG